MRTQLVEIVAWLDHVIYVKDDSRRERSRLIFFTDATGKIREIPKKSIRTYQAVPGKPNHYLLTMLPRTEQERKEDPWTYVN
jgi:hypothetical protein